MSKDDYFVIAYKILAYLYTCLKLGETPDINSISADEYEIAKSYWDYIMRQLYTEGYIEGVSLAPVLGKKHLVAKIDDDIMITPKGIDYLQNNSTMNKAKEFLKTIKEVIPGL